LAWGASPPSCSRSAHPAWPAPRGAIFHPEGGKEKPLLPRELHRLEGKRKKTSRPSPFLFKKEEKPSTPWKRTSRLLPSLFRGTPDLLADDETASSWMKE